MFQLQITRTLEIIIFTRVYIALYMNFKRYCAYTAVVYMISQSHCTSCAALYMKSKIHCTYCAALNMILKSHCASGAVLCMISKKHIVLIALHFLKKRTSENSDQKAKSFA